MNVLNFTVEVALQMKSDDINNHYIYLKALYVANHELMYFQCHNRSPMKKLTTFAVWYVLSLFGFIVHLYHDSGM